MKKPAKRVTNVFSKLGILAFISIFFIITIVGCSSHTGEESKVEEADITPAKAEYVGSERCKDCHWREHDTWKGTLHSKFMQPSGESNILGDFQINNTLIVKVSDHSPESAGKKITTTMLKKDGKYYINTIGPDWEFHDYEISYIIGIGERQNYLTKFPNGAIHVLPVEWSAKKEKWVDNNGLKMHYPGGGNYWSDAGRIWQFKCGGCHSTGMKINYDKASHSFDTTFASLGIGCESCHGAGSNHVKAASIYFEGEKDTIINPANLPWRLRAMVCGQCHGSGASTAKIMSSKKGFPEQYAFPYNFMAGQSLNLHFVSESGDDMGNHQQYDEWEKSEHAKAGITCTACHGTHQEGLHENKAQTKLMAGSLCTSCHKTTEKRAAHRIHTYGSCIDCHMLETKESGRNHTFQFVSPEESLRAGGVDKKPNSCSGCHHHKKSPLEGLIDFLDAAKKSDMPVPFTVHGR